ncbi:ABC transporter substrate-binding protein [Actinomadura barringtoniae]|uniref:ABC transporter substrate-binding protein n=1 Tax=Actinomadura barringtoniae TaxID=1427535 RepID=A0A939PVG4_9ACTN|nr:ABC transporter substrate-binding protein [Actinomadura barringtoniae]MBO2455749.1 ABC transporter substrate-binding protein [Actinomadura barringtoniae]
MKRLGRTFTGVIALAALGTAATGCAGQAASGAAAKNPVILTNWFAQAEQGGYWQAAADQTAKGEGVTLNVKQGGPGIQTIPQVTAGQATFGVGNADEVLVARKNGLPIVAVAAGFDTNLQCMMFHKPSGISSFKDLNGRTVARIPSPYWDYLKHGFGLNKVKEINNTGSLADFKRNKDLVQQCYVTAEPYTAQKEGIKDLALLNVAKDGGYNPYGNLLFTTEQVIKQNPDLVRKVVAASIRGWKDFNTDPAAAKKTVLSTNPDTVPDAFDFAAATIKKGGYLGADPGSMTDQRWRTLRDQLGSAGVVPKDFDYQKAFTTKYLPAG